jgi:hypothetical protein
MKETAGLPVNQRYLKALKRTLQEMLGTDRWYGTMPKVCLCLIVWVIETTELEEVIAAVDMETKQKKQKERKRERKRKKEQKRKERNAELRRRKKDREFAYYTEEFEYYYEERAAFEEQYDDEQCTIYHRSYGWIGQQPSSGFFDIARPAVGVFASSDRL